MPIQRKKFELSPNLKLGVGRGRSNKILKYGAIFSLGLAVILAANAIRLVYRGGATAGPQITPQVLGATDIKAPSAPNPTPAIIPYRVGKGDTLFNISQKFNVTWTTIATLNNLKSPFSLKPGQILQIPQ